jgi:phosphoglycerol transferase MdoB-like AlkP superfamily enzyme
VQNISFATETNSPERPIVKILGLMKDALNEFFRISLSLFVILCLLRIGEFLTTTLRLDLESSKLKIILECLWFDISTWLIFTALSVVPFLIFSLAHKNIGKLFLFGAHLVFIIGYISLLIVFAERTVPFDHEIFLRNSRDIAETVLSVVAVKYCYSAAAIVSISAFFLIYGFILVRRNIPILLSVVSLAAGILLFFIPGLSIPQKNHFRQFQEYFVAVNKMQYFVSDCYSYYFVNKAPLSSPSHNDQMDGLIEFYQRMNPQFAFIGKEYPFLHSNKLNNVLKDYFRPSDRMPNIVVIIYESLTSDFSGENAPSGSFTPFLDSLADSSLSWYNTLSNTQGTFGSAPSILGSLPFGQNGFAQQSQMPNHLTLVSILKRNGWQTNYFSGSHIDYDNFGGFLRKQGIDFMSIAFPDKYKSIKVGKEEWVNYYPDDELYDYSLEALDAINKEPYISAYLTVTPHSPYIYFPKKKYEQLFLEEIKRRNLPEKKRNFLLEYKEMFASVMFSDDALRRFINAYKQRKDFSNTIFIITGDHHHDYFPRRNEIDHFNIPLIIYSPLLKKPQRFDSVNCHFNIAPTLLSLLVDTYRLKNYPKYISWMGDELDTSLAFRNMHHIPFMWSNRNIDSYLFEDYFLNDDSLYKIRPNLELEKVEDPVLMKKYASIMENFREINYYVCSHNKLYPENEKQATTQAHEFYKYEDLKEQSISRQREFYDKIVQYRIPPDVKKMMVTVSFEARFDADYYYRLPLLSTIVLDERDKSELFNSCKNIYQFFDKDRENTDWLKFADEDIINMNKNEPDQRNQIDIKIWNRYKVFLKIRNMVIKLSQVG